MNLPLDATVDLSDPENPRETGGYKGKRCAMISNLTSRSSTDYHPACHSRCGYRRPFRRPATVRASN